MFKKNQMSFLTDFLTWPDQGIMHKNGIKASQLLNGHLTFEYCSIKKSPATLNFKWLTLEKEALYKDLCEEDDFSHIFPFSRAKLDISQASKRHQLVSYSSYSIYLMKKQKDSNLSIFISPLILFIHPETKLLSYNNFFWRFIFSTILDVLYWINANKKLFYFPHNF